MYVCMYVCMYVMLEIGSGSGSESEVNRTTTAATWAEVNSWKLTTYSPAITMWIVDHSLHEGHTVGKGLLC